MKQKRFFRKYYLNFKAFFSNWRKMLALLSIITLSLALAPFLIHFLVSYSYSDRKYKEISEIDSDVVIVFGAGLLNGEPGPILRDRVQVAVDLYQAGKAKKIIMSGDNRYANYDEPSAMIAMAKELGVPDVMLQPDYAGRRTYDTCLRAREIFDLSSAILVTQGFHMDRALYTCNALGVESIGVIADSSKYPDEWKYSLRDKLALIKALWEINIDTPDDVVLGNTIEL